MRESGRGPSTPHFVRSANGMTTLRMTKIRNPIEVTEGLSDIDMVDYH